MCCDATGTLDLPVAVIRAIAHYRRLLDARGPDWGDDRVELFHFGRFSKFGPVTEAFATVNDWAAAIRTVIGDDVPAGIAVVRIGAGGELRADLGPARPSIAGQGVPIDVVVDSAATSELRLTVAGRPLTLRAHGAALERVELDGADPAFTVALDGRTLRVEGAVRPAPAAELRLVAPACVRWSVTDSTGGAWFPDGVLPKWDYHHRPFFHAHQATLAVPAEPLVVACARGLEFDRSEQAVTPAAGQRVEVAGGPARLFDPTAHGWYGGDLHVHMNYGGDLVCAPEDAARMQRGEGLHLANFVAGNSQTSLVYDRELLESTAGADLPWSTDELVARAGVEYRNDLLGHVHALGPGRPPSRYYSGHECSDHPEDWPPNAVACKELRDLGATVGYAHPVASEFPPDGSPSRFLAYPRSVEARELVADAALGLVDSVDVMSPFNHEGAVFLYHRLLSCGLRLAATAGTDVFLSFSHGPEVASNPPGWGRVYAQLGGRPLSLAGFQEAIRAGRTMVTNGPWLELEVNGHGPGAVLDLATGDQLDVRTRATGPGAERLELVGPDGVMAEGEGVGELRLETSVEGPSWIAAVARGGRNPNTLDVSALAHTSPVYLDVAGRRVARAADARWCLELLDALERLVRERGHFQAASREAHLGDVVAVLDQARAFYRRVADAATR
jgi:hypothetical protein